MEFSDGVSSSSFFLLRFWRSTQQNLRKPSSSHFQGLKIIPYAKRGFSPFDSRLKNDVGAPSPSEGGKTAFRLHNSAISESI
jgi:hypothetical protein